MLYPTLYEYLTYTICEGDSVLIGNNIYYSSGSFTDTILSTYNCDSIIYTTIDQSIPVASMNENNGNLNYNVNAGSPPYNLQLFGPNGLVLNLNNNNGTGVFTPTISGNYFLVVEDQPGCFADTVFYQIDVISSIENNIFDNVKIYPNPTNDFLNIEFKNYRSQSFIIIFENTLGQEILRHEIQNGNQDFSQQFNISEFSKGIYYIKMLFENTKIVEIITKN